MLFGNAQRFAIELELDDNPGGHWFFGRICYWICGDPVGDYHLGASLRDVLFLWERIFFDKAQRSNAYLFSLDTKTLVLTLHGSMFGNESSDGLIERRAIEEQWARHDIAPRLDVFNKWEVFLVEDNLVARCVCSTPENNFHECVLSTGEFDSVLAEAISFLTAQGCGRGQGVL